MSNQDDINMQFASEISGLGVAVSNLEHEQNKQRGQIDDIDEKLTALVHEVKLIRFALIGIAVALAGQVPLIDRLLSKLF